MKLSHLMIAMLAVAGAGSAMAAADTYNLDPTHTFPSFEADHMGMSVWRGKFNKTKGTVTLDRAAKSGTLDLVIEADSIDFGLDAMNTHAKKADMFNVEKFPQITYKSNKLKFTGDQLTQVDGELTLLGVTKPVTLKVDKFKCIMHPRYKREVCGADATAQFKRDDFGLTFGLPAFSPEVKLAIQVEAIKAD
ncbi:MULTISPECIES: YceI family protein [Janthinobacterium]|uniref:Polyisoprenoid-binding protein YceI n=1 Tax=Janthinobacterium psychrotolerans TaxID=1747903 RepID=A0A1A7C2W9_9BURK|nr:MULTISPECIES: YceI family protein [Janthinobacterium]OBV40296.1 Polyisoprenoid-binding protein YceI [Janthinobacterium psychrotolerans]